MDIPTLYTYFTACGSVTTDSRHCPTGSLFIALKGDTFNGNAFARQALEAGCRYAVVDEAEFISEDPRILLVDNCLEALQGLATYHRRRMGTRILAITGTNGKTTTKELVTAVLRERYDVLSTQGNLNNHIGVPLTLLRLTPRHELAVIEMGANHPHEIATLTRIAEPDYGLITNVGKAHLEGFGSLEGVLRAKGELYDFLRQHGQHVIFIDKDNENLASIAHGLIEVGYGLAGGEGPYVSGRCRSCSPFLSLEWERDGQCFEADTRLVGSYNLKNALAAIAVGCYFNVSPEQIGKALAAYVPCNNRSQLTETASNRLIVDAYNANPSSMRAALENFHQLKTPMPKMVVLGDMKELGKSSLEEHRKVVAYVTECGFDRVAFVGEAFGTVDSNAEHYPDVEAVKEAFARQKPTGFYILIKGSNRMKLSELQAML